jgi:hypothetical protein
MGREALPRTDYAYRGTGQDTLTPPDYAALLDEQERQEIRRAAAYRGLMNAARTGRIPLQPCGTTAAYQRHMRHDEDPCEACREANRRSLRERRAAE